LRAPKGQATPRIWLLDVARRYFSSLLSITLGLIFGYSLLEHIVSSETPVATYDDEPEPDDMVYNVIIVILVFTAKLLFDFILLIFLQWMRLRRLRNKNSFTR